MTFPRFIPEPGLLSSFTIEAPALPDSLLQIWHTERCKQCLRYNNNWLTRCATKLTNSGSLMRHPGGRGQGICSTCKEQANYSKVIFQENFSYTLMMKHHVSNGPRCFPLTRRRQCRRTLALVHSPAYYKVGTRRYLSGPAKARCFLCSRKSPWVGVCVFN
jgi:hypothetical protein